MPPAAVDISRFRAQIEKRILVDHHKQIEVVNWLRTEGVSITAGILKARCKEWGLSRRGATTDPAAVERVYDRFHKTTENDSKIAAALTAEGLSISSRQVKELRLQYGWRRKGATEDQIKSQRAETFEMVQHELEEGTIRAYGRELVQTHLRVNHAYRARQDDVRDALRELDSKGTAARKPGPRKRRKRGGEYLARGPDWLWCIDGHDKFRNYGIEIYAAVDAFSRKILWFYIGNSNRRAVSILQQGISVIRSFGRCPRFWRSDHGNETLLLADSHFSFYREHKRSQGFTDDEINALRVRHCYMYGSSTSNIRIENVWQRLINSQTAPWIVSLFSLLTTFQLPPVTKFCPGEEAGALEPYLIWETRLRGVRSGLPVLHIFMFLAWVTRLRRCGTYAKMAARLVEVCM
jgi:hypothetical protein